MLTIIPLKKISLPPNGLHLWLSLSAPDLPSGSGVIIDTGASQTVFDPDIMGNYLSDIRENTETDFASGVNAMIEKTEFGYINEPIIGAQKCKDLSVGIMSLEHIRSIYSEFFGLNLCGLIGSDFLQKYSAKIDYKLSNLTLYSD
ncbi:MAG: hypothetical protein PF448_11270 [Bacteroidales bacterium]|jgi:hypothetical protein|nr:hypothetical protein [Bacteroidales bacterium]